jgi:hypothetical protein
MAALAARHRRAQYRTARQRGQRRARPDVHRPVSRFRPYSPDGGYQIDSSLVLAFARIESRFQTQGHVAGRRARTDAVMPTLPGGWGTDPDYALHRAGVRRLRQRYIVQL